jgi:hypothetical protein
LFLLFLFDQPNAFSHSNYAKLSILGNQHVEQPKYKVKKANKQPPCRNAKIGKKKQPKHTTEEQGKGGFD